MNRAKLIEHLQTRFPYMSRDDVEVAVWLILGAISHSLATGGRVEIRGFGSFGVRSKKAYSSRNPKNGNPFSVPVRHFPFFKPGKIMKNLPTPE